ncbi:MAG TPA: hypothetical protein VKA53_04735 [Thermoanaerobaculia bacterium]|nr:hypothetical protein [Thermoanaerobaculia bacterium]
MPDTTTTIDRAQREGLYELIRNHLGSIEDFFVALERTRDFAKAERLGLEFAEDFRLLQDIGWAERDERETFELTMPPPELMRALNRLHDEAAAVLTESDERAYRKDDAETEARFQHGLDACEEVLVGLGPEGGSA